MALDTWTLGTGIDPQPGLGKVIWVTVKGSKEQYSKDNQAATRVFLVDWTQRKAFIDDLLGFSSLNIDKSIHRVVPDPHPDLLNLFAMDASIEPVVSAPTMVGNKEQFALAEVTATYKFPFFAVFQDNQIGTGAGSELKRYVIRNTSFASEQLSTGLGGYLFCSSPSRALNFSPGILTGCTNMVYQWMQLPAIPTDPFTPPVQQVAQSLIGKVNSTGFDSKYPAGTILFVAYEAIIVPPMVADDSLHWQVNYTFLRRDNGAAIGGDSVNGRAGHNYIYRPDTGLYDLVTAGSGAGTTSGKMIYGNGDLNTLFTISG